MTGGVLHTGDGGSSDRRGTSYRRWQEQGGRLHTGNRGSSDREQQPSGTAGAATGYFVSEMSGAVTGGILYTGDWTGLFGLLQ